MTETYEVFGSKENLSFTLEVKANDLQTASDIGEMLKREMLILRRINTEADGLTIFEMTRGFVGQARDLSATAPSYVYTINVTASADWKVYVPLVTRLVNLEITGVPAQTDFLGKLPDGSENEGSWFRDFHYVLRLRKACRLRLSVPKLRRSA